MAVIFIGALSILISCESTGAGGTSARPEIKELAADIVPGSGSSYPENFIGHAGAVYFAAEDSSHERELWRYDGQSAELVWDINPGSGSSYPYGMTAVDGRLYFSADNGSSGDELFMYQSPK